MISDTPADGFESGQAEMSPFSRNPVPLAPVSHEKALGAMEDILLILKGRGLSEGTIDEYRSHYQALGAYIAKENLPEVDGQTPLDFLAARYNLHIAGFHVKKLGSIANSHIRPLVVLDWYLRTGFVDTRAKARKPEPELPEAFVDSHERFLNSLQRQELSAPSFQWYRSITKQFILHLSENGVKSVDGISGGATLSFLERFGTYQANSFRTVVSGIRRYLSFLTENGLLEEDVASVLPRVKTPRYAGVPHAWTKEELRALLSAVDRAGPTGKRDYAIYLLVIQTGLRAADIRALKLDDIHWEERKIRLTTSKNSRNAEFPLPETTGWAIIDYLRHGRPKTDCDRVFVRHIAPYGPIGNTCRLDYELRRHIKKAGIVIKDGERSGIHTLRSSFAKNMLDAGAPLPVISQTLTHSNVNTAALYLKIDMAGLRKCALPIDGWEAGE